MPQRQSRDSTIGAKAGDLSSTRFPNLRSWAAGVLLSTQLVPATALSATRQATRPVDPPAAKAESSGSSYPFSALARFPDRFSPSKLAGLDPDTQKHVLVLAGYINRHHARYLLDLQKRTIGTGQSVLTVLDSKGHTLVQNLAGLATAKQIAVAPITLSRRRLIVAEAVRFFATPGFMSQAQRGTCRASSPFWEFNLSDPGEVSRLLHDLLVTGKAEFRWPGRFLELDPLALTGDRKGVRSLIENILYIAGMKFEAGAKGHYDIALDKFTPDSPPDHRSLRESFFYRDYDRLTVHTDRQNVGEILQALKAHLPGYIGVVLKWEYESSCGSEANSGSTVKNESHAVTAVSNDDEGIIIRNPWGRNYHQTGQRVSAIGAPVRVIVDSHSGLEKIPYNDFEERLLSVDLPCNGQHLLPETLALLTEETLRLYNTWQTGQFPLEIQAYLNEVFWSDGFRQSSPRLQAEVMQILMLHHNKPDVRRLLLTGLTAVTQIQEEADPEKINGREAKISEIWGALRDKDNPLFQPTLAPGGK